MPRKGLVVNSGAWKGMSDKKGDYDSLCETLRDVLASVQFPVYEGHRQTGTEPLEAKIIRAEELEAEMTQGEIVIVVFVSHSMMQEADRLKRSHRRTKVVLLTGDPIEDEGVIVLGKHWAAMDNLKNLAR